MELVDKEIRGAMVAALNGLLVQWRDPSFSVAEHMVDQVLYWTTRTSIEGPGDGEGLHVAAAFLVAPSEQEAKDWYRALRDLPDHPPPPRTTQPK